MYWTSVIVQTPWNNKKKWIKIKISISIICLQLSEPVLLFGGWRILSNSLCRLGTNPVRINSFIIHLVSSWNLLPTRRRLSGQSFMLNLLTCLTFFDHNAGFEIVFLSWIQIQRLCTRRGVQQWMKVRLWSSRKWSNAVLFFFQRCFKEGGHKAACRCSTHGCQHVQAERHLQ